MKGRQRVTTLAQEHAWLRPVVSVAGAQVVGQGSLILSIPFLARIYGPSALGLFAVLAAWSNFVAVAATCKLELLLPREDDASVAWAARRVKLLALVGATVYGSILAVTGVVSPTPSIAVSAGLLVLASYANAVVNVDTMARLSDTGSRPVARARAAVGTVQAVAQLGIGLFWATPEGLVIGYVLGNLAGVVLLWPRGVVVPDCRPRAGVTDPWPTVRVALPNALLTNLTIAGITVGFEWVYGAATTGSFFVAKRLIVAPTQILATALGELFYVSASKGKREEIYGAIQHRMKVLVPFAVLLGLGGGVLSLVAPRLLGEEWAEVSVLTLSLIPLAIGQLVVTPFGNSLLVIGRERLRLQWTAARLAATALAFMVIYAIGSPIQAGAWIVNGVSAIAMIALALIIRRALVGEQPDG